jgi:hypothetical protein
MEEQEKIKAKEDLLKVYEIFKGLENSTETVSQELSYTIKELGLISNSEIEGKIFNIFQNTFKNLASNSIVVYEDTTTDSYRGKETIGINKYGFVIRRYKQGKALEYFDHMMTVIKHKDDIIKNMRNTKSYAKHKKVLEFEKFCEIIDKDFKIEEQIEIELNEPLEILNIVYPNDYKENQKLFKFGFENITSIKINSHGRIIYGIDDKTLPYKMNSDNVLEYVNNNIFKSVIKEIKTKLKEKCSGLIIKQRQVLDELEKEFGVYNLMSNL